MILNVEQITLTFKIMTFASNILPLGLTFLSKELPLLALDPGKFGYDR